jgi:hypothetical protein
VLKKLAIQDEQAVPLAGTVSFASETLEIPARTYGEEAEFDLPLDELLAFTAPGYQIAYIPGLAMEGCKCAMRVILKATGAFVP